MARRAAAKGILSAMMPVYNEQATLPEILDRVLARPEIGEVIAVDDGSTDGSWAIIQDRLRRDSRLRAFRLDRNRGKGAALRWAIDELSLPFAVVQDADLEYDPADYPKLLQPLLDGSADAVYGRREGVSTTSLSRAARLLFKAPLSDVGTGYKVMGTELWRRLGAVERGFAFDAGVTGRLLRLGSRVVEVPVSYRRRRAGEGAKLEWWDGVAGLLCLARLRLSDAPEPLRPGITPTA